MPHRRARTHELDQRPGSRLEALQSTCPDLTCHRACIGCVKILGPELGPLERIGHLQHFPCHRGRGARRDVHRMHAPHDIVHGIDVQAIAFPSDVANHGPGLLQPQDAVQQLLDEGPRRQAVPWIQTLGQVG